MLPNSKIPQAKRRVALGCAAGFLALALAVTGPACASDGNGSVYPLSAETIMPGMMPGAGGTMLVEFTDSYTANELVGSNGKALMPGFHLRVGAAAVKVMHHWGFHVFGGSFVTSAALPMLDVHLSAPIGSQNKVGIGNGDVEAAVAYHKGALNWWYGAEYYPPGFSYTKGALVNIGQHNNAVAPSGAFTCMPDHGRTEVSSKFQYIVNYTNDATNYRSGNEFVWEYAGMRNLAKSLAIGGNGYYYQQTTGDTQNGLTYLDGNRGRNVTFGPEIRYHFKHFLAILKWQKDFLVQNRAVGNSIWLQFGVPLEGHRD
ncbi:MAG: transporter [Bryobacteraceae bacterium]